MSCGDDGWSVNWGAQVAREPGMSVPPATSPECRALVADAEAVARNVMRYVLVPRGATMAEIEAARYALPGSSNRTWGLSESYRPVDQYVDIYLSAGENTGAGDAASPSCNVRNDGMCRLYRLRWNLATGEVVGSPSRVSTAPSVRFSDVGEVEPALSPDETRVSWIRRYREVLLHPEVVTGRSLVTREQGAASTEEVETGDDWPEWPNWYSNEELLFQAPEPSEPGREDNMSSLWWKIRDQNPIAVLGPSGFFSRGTSFQDPDTHRAPMYRAVDGPRIVTFGGAVGEKVPRVTGLRGEAEEEFELGFGEGGQCHHPAWNIAGDRILCHRHYPTESFGDQQQLRALYEYAYDATTGRWAKSATAAGANGRLFDPPSTSALEHRVRGLSAATCYYYSYKYAEWCGSNDHVIVTLFCTDRRNSVVVSSRVVVISLREEDPEVGGPRHWDVTGALERAVGVPEGSWHSVFSTCSSVHAIPDWTPALG